MLRESLLVLSISLLVALCNGMNLWSTFADVSYDETAAREMLAKLPTVQDRVPIMLIPPLSGSALKAHLSHAPEPHIYCKHNGDEQLWMLRRSELMPWNVACFGHNFALEYNETSDTYHSYQGVTVEVNMTIDSLIGNDPSSENPYVLVGQALTTMGYQPNRDLRGYPYDWRLGPHQYMVNGVYEGLKVAMEKSYVENGNRSALMIAMSMGSPWLVLFLEEYVDQAWKDKHVQSVLSLSGLFTGSLIATLDQISPSLGWQHGLPMPIANMALSLIRTWGSVSWFAPDAAWFNDTVLFRSGTGEEYTAHTLDKLFNVAATSTNAAMWEHARMYPPTPPPRVEIHLWYGFNVSTPCGFTYTAKDWVTEPNVTLCDGDGFAPMVSMIGPPTAWQTEQTQPVHFRAYNNVTHGGILADPTVIADIAQFVADVSKRTSAKKSR